MRFFQKPKPFEITTPLNLDEADARGRERAIQAELDAILATENLNSLLSEPEEKKIAAQKQAEDYQRRREEYIRRSNQPVIPAGRPAFQVDLPVDQQRQLQAGPISNQVANNTNESINTGAREAAKANIRKRENLLSQAMDKVKEEEITVARSLLGDGPVTSGIDTLLGKIDWGNLLSIIGNPAFSAALMQPGISPMQAIVGGIGAARANQAAAASAEREARIKEYEAQTKRIDAQGATPPKLTSEVAKLYDQMEAATKMTETAQNVRITLGDSDSEWSTGGAGKLAKTLRAFAAFFGQDPGKMSVDELTRELAKAKTAVLGTKIFGREANKQELEILKELVSENDWWTSRSQILNAVNALAKEAETRRFNLANRARAFGLPLAHTEMRIPDYPFKRLGSSSGNVLPS